MKKIIAVSFFISLFSLAANARSIRPVPPIHPVPPIIPNPGIGYGIVNQTQTLSIITTRLLNLANREVHSYPAFHPYIKREQQQALSNVVQLNYATNRLKQVAIRAKRGLLLRPKLRLRIALQNVNQKLQVVSYTSDSLFRRGRKYSVAHNRVDRLVQRAQQQVRLIRYSLSGGLYGNRF